ncbi:PLDc N-terminal domain-containing protein [Cellulomonas sp. Marseille-Q8402]
MARALFFLVIIGLAVYALADIATSDDRARRGIPRGAWLLIALVPVVGAVSWILSSRAARAAGGAGPATGRPGGGGPSGPRRSGPLAPDDDPEFLWRLEQERIRRERDRQREDGSNGDVPDDGTRG